VEMSSGGTAGGGSVRRRSHRWKRSATIECVAPLVSWNSIRPLEACGSASLDLAYGRPKDMPKGVEGDIMASSLRGALAEGPKVKIA
jgi:hypothetical protein